MCFSSSSSSGVSIVEAAVRAALAPCPLQIPSLSLGRPLPDAVLDRFFPFLAYVLRTRWDNSLRFNERTPAQSLPLWDNWFEKWYRMYHPSVWRLLEEDEKKEMLYSAELNQEREEWVRRMERIPSFHDGWQRVKELERDLNAVLDSQAFRLRSIFLLHIMREYYLQLQRARYPGKSDQQILEELPKGKQDHLPTFSPGSVWTFDCPVPPSTNMAHAKIPPPSHSLYQSNPFALLLMRSNPDRFFIPNITTFPDSPNEETPATGAALEGLGGEEAEEEYEGGPPPAYDETKTSTSATPYIV